MRVRRRLGPGQELKTLVHVSSIPLVSAQVLPCVSTRDIPLIPRPRRAGTPKMSADLVLGPAAEAALNIGARRRILSVKALSSFM